MTTKKNTRKSGTRFDRTAAAQAVALADFLGSDAEAAKTLGITTRSIRRYRERALTDPELSAIVHEKKEQLRADSKDWAPVAIDTLKACISKVKELVAEAKVSDLRAVVGAIKILGDLQIVRDFLGEQPGDNPEGQAASEAATRAGRAAPDIESENDSTPIH